MSLTNTRSGRQASQQPRELAQFLDIIRGARSYLEVGARHGDTFYEVMRSLPVGSRGVAIDLPAGPWGSGSSSKALKDAVADLVSQGYDAQAIFGSSQDIDLDEQFDVVLIDADHRYEAVKADFEKHGNAKIVAFHDIDGDGIELNGMPVEVPKFWREIKNNFRHVEIIAPDDARRMGIGVIFR